MDQLISLGLSDRNWMDEADSRKWEDFSLLAEISSLGNARRDHEAMEKIVEALRQYPDFYFPHAWKIRLLMRAGHISSARLALSVALNDSKLKATLCTTFASDLFQARGELIESAHWWLVHAQMKLKSQRWTKYDYEPFLYLAHIAHGIGEKDVADKLFKANMRIVGWKVLNLVGRTQEQLERAVALLPSEAADLLRQAFRSIGPQVVVRLSPFRNTRQMLGGAAARAISKVLGVKE
jgi:hypothetical protein